ncbi:hypothetical protein BAU26_26210 [Bacillus sp. N35-10-4]|nr:hypothetical protein BAU26_26210 [Bacillus sp. N35-10-4]
MMGLYTKEKIIFFIINKYKGVIVNKKISFTKPKKQCFPSDYNIPLIGKIFQKLLVDCIM